MMGILFKSIREVILLAAAVAAMAGVYFWFDESGDREEERLARRSSMISLAWEAIGRAQTSGWKKGERHGLEVLARSGAFAEGADLTGLYLYEGNFKRLKASDADFRRSFLNRADFEWAELYATQFEGSQEYQFRSVNFAHASLVSAKFSGNIETLFPEAILVDASFKDAMIGGLFPVSFKKADLTAARFENVVLNNVSFQGAIFASSAEEMKARNDELYKISTAHGMGHAALFNRFGQAYYEGNADDQRRLTATTFDNVTFDKVDLRNTDLSALNLEGVDLGATCIDETTKLPVGVEVEEFCREDSRGGVTLVNGDYWPAYYQPIWLETDR